MTETPAGVGVPNAGEFAGCLGADVIAAAGSFGELVEQRLQPFVLGEAQRLTVQLGGQPSRLRSTYRPVSHRCESPGTIPPKRRRGALASARLGPYPSEPSPNKVMARRRCESPRERGRRGLSCRRRQVCAAAMSEKGRSLPSLPTSEMTLADAEVG